MTAAMAAHERDRQSAALEHWVPRAVAIIGGVGFVALGLWAMVAPRSFFDALATFEPYNRHFLQDIGAFQVGLGAVLLLAGVPARADGLTVALVGVGVGAALHAVSQVVGRGLGGTPQTEIPSFAALAALLLAAGGFRWRHLSSPVARQHALGAGDDKEPRRPRREGRSRKRERRVG